MSCIIADLFYLFICRHMVFTLHGISRIDRITRTKKNIHEIKQVGNCKPVELANHFQELKKIVIHYKHIIMQK